jgi:hypothetical protein
MIYAVFTGRAPHAAMLGRQGRATFTTPHTP